MFVLIGLAIIALKYLGGFMMEGGKPAALMQITEFIIIGGAGFGRYFYHRKSPALRNGGRKGGHRASKGKSIHQNALYGAAQNALRYVYDGPARGSGLARSACRSPRRASSSRTPVSPTITTPCRFYPTR